MIQKILIAVFAAMQRTAIKQRTWQITRPAYGHEVRDHCTPRVASACPWTLNFSSQALSATAAAGAVARVILVVGVAAIGAWLTGCRVDGLWPCKASHGCQKRQVPCIQREALSDLTYPFRRKLPFPLCNLNFTGSRTWSRQTSVGRMRWCQDSPSRDKFSTIQQASPFSAEGLVFPHVFPQKFQLNLLKALLRSCFPRMLLKKQKSRDSLRVKTLPASVDCPQPQKP